MIVTAWKSGAFGQDSLAFGIKIGAYNRDLYFKREWTSVKIEIAQGRVLTANITAGFWKKSPELRHEEFRNYFQSAGLLPWPDRRPPEFDLEPLESNLFRLWKP